ncbi:hypothetical protein B0H13DRAFT_1904307 [Mycena leptocephala]|nr:hypothetical protein B0H13DRAFT_1904307 [Mycena leptocephala]
MQVDQGHRHAREGIWGRVKTVNFGILDHTASRQEKYGRGRHPTRSPPDCIGRVKGAGRDGEDVRGGSPEHPRIEARQRKGGGKKRGEEVPHGCVATAGGAQTGGDGAVGRGPKDACCRDAGVNTVTVPARTRVATVLPHRRSPSPLHKAPATVEGRGSSQDISPQCDAGTPTSFTLSSPCPRPTPASSSSSSKAQASRAGCCFGTNASRCCTSWVGYVVAFAREAREGRGRESGRSRRRKEEGDGDEMRQQYRSGSASTARKHEGRGAVAGRKRGQWWEGRGGRNEDGTKGQSLLYLTLLFLLVIPMLDFPILSVCDFRDLGGRKHR